MTATIHNLISRLIIWKLQESMTSYIVVTFAYDTHSRRCNSRSVNGTSDKLLISSPTRYTYDGTCHYSNPQKKIHQPPHNNTTNNLLSSIPPSTSTQPAQTTYTYDTTTISPEPNAPTYQKSDLHYYGYRYYSPELGRWISRDPIGILGGVNLYNFNQNSVIGTFDYIGLKCCCNQKKLNELIAQTPFKGAIDSIGSKCLHSIKCGNLTDGTDGQYSLDTGDIIICGTDYENILRHELQHAKQCNNAGCNNGTPSLSQCVKQLQKEIDAYICGDTGSNSKEACDLNKTPFSKLECVKRARRSVLSKGACPNCTRYDNPFTPDPAWGQLLTFNPTCIVPKKSPQQ